MTILYCIQCGESFESNNPASVLCPEHRDESERRGAISSATELSTNQKPEKPALLRGATVIREVSQLAFSPTEMVEQSGWSVCTTPGYTFGDLIDDRYKVENILSGAMGNVYICTDINQKIKFAIKQPKEEMLANRDLFSRVLLEADAWTKLGMHPNIAYCFFVRKLHEVPHIFIEYVDGGNLEDWTSDCRCTDYKTGIDMAIQFCHGLERAHDRGMIHRDIKPKNILVTQEGQVKVTDFGLVGAGKNTEKFIPRFDNQHKTLLGDIMGTPAYMPPEQWLDPRQKSTEAPDGVWYESDVYSFGVCLWEMFCGKRPYEMSINPQSKQPDPRDLRKDIPDGLCNLLLKCVALDRRKRHQNFQQLRRELNKVYQDLFGNDAPSYHLELHDTTADELNNQGYSYIELGKNHEARKCFEEAVAADSTHPEAVFNLALLQWRNGEIDDIEALRRVKNCLSNPSANKEKIAEMMAFIHAERFDSISAKELLQEYSGRFDTLFGTKNIATIECRRLEGHDGNVSSVQFSFDGRYVLSGSDDTTVKLWDTRTGACIRTFTGHKERVNTVGLSDDGRYGLSGSRDTSIKLWELATGKCLHTLIGESDEVKSVSLNRDGRFAVSGSGARVMFWDLSAGKCLRSFDGHLRNISSVCLSGDGKYALSGSEDQTLRLWDTSNGKCLRIFDGHRRDVTSVCLSANLKYAVSGSKDFTVKLWETETGQCLRSFEGHSSHVESVNMSADGNYVISGSSASLLNDNTLKLWDVKTGKCLHTLQNYNKSINSAGLTTDGRMAVLASGTTITLLTLPVNSASSSSEFQLTRLRVFAEIKDVQDELLSAIVRAEHLLKEKHFIQSFALLYDAWEKNNFKDDANISRVYTELCSKARRKIFSFCYLENTLNHDETIWSVAITTDNSSVVSGSHDRTVRIWDVTSGQCVRTLEGHSDIVFAVGLSGDRTHALSGSKDKTLRIWDIETGRCLQNLTGHNGMIKSVGFSTNGKFVVSGSWDKTIKLWEIETGRCLNTFSGHGFHVESVAVTHDDTFIISGSTDKTIRIWDIKTGQCVRTLTSKNGSVTAVNVSADGKYIISGSKNLLEIWNIETGQCMHTLTGHSDDVTSVNLTRDGRFAISGSWDGTLKLWDTENETCLQTMEGHNAQINCAYLSTDEKYILSGGWDKTIKIWRLIWKLEFDH